MENGQPMERLRCVVERITFQSDGYSVLKCAAKGFSDLVTVVGMMPDTHVGSVLTLGGQWKIDSRYGRQFQVASFEETLPATVYGASSGRTRWRSSRTSRTACWRFPASGRDGSRASKRDGRSRRKSRISCSSCRGMT